MHEGAHLRIGRTHALPDIDTCNVANTRRIYTRPAAPMLRHSQAIGRHQDNAAGASNTESKHIGVLPKRHGGGEKYGVSRNIICEPPQ